ncbi:MAG: protease SohB [Gammaproteobacteria bacterium]|nr:MAG: protease SohB [Gammaproteobacteria bacterium]
MGFLSAYLLFVAKAVTALIFVVLCVFIVVTLISRSKKSKAAEDDELEIKYLNSHLHDDKIALEYETLEKADKKKLKKEPVKPKKGRPRLFVLNFDGDIQASETDFLRRQITAIIQTADKNKDKVLLRLESPGGVVHGYGLAASQLDRLKQSGIKLVVAVDKVAASGGYMMACVGDKIIAAPFAILGSIGVLAQIPNIHRLLKEKHVDVELHTAGKYKRTLTLMGENTDEGREKFKEDLELTHDLFKQHIARHRPQITIDDVATGETWYGQQAIDNHLADQIMTSDDYILNAVKTMDVYQLSIEEKQSLIERLREQFIHKNKAEINSQYFL